MQEAAARGAAAGGGGGEDPDVEHLCPICLDNEADAAVGGNTPGMCVACGQMYCGACNSGPRLLAGKSPNCPVCRAPFQITPKEQFQRLWKLAHDRSPGRHTAEAHFNIGYAFAEGEGVAQNVAEAIRFYTMAAAEGYATAHSNLGSMYFNGKGVAQDRAKAMQCFKRGADQGNADSQFHLGVMCTPHGVPREKATNYFQLAAAQGHAKAIKCLVEMQERTAFPALPPGTAIITLLLNAPEYNNRNGVVMLPSAGIKPGRAAVLLKGEVKPRSFKVMNLRVVEASPAEQGAAAADPASTDYTVGTGVNDLD